MRTSDEFRAAAERRGIKWWGIHNCSMCDYPCGFMIDHGAVYYDSGCDCVGGGPRIRSRDWNDIAENYNIQRNPAVVAEYDAFWGLDA